MMLVFWGFVAGMPLWIIVGWVMRGDSYCRHHVRTVPAPEPPVVAPLPAPVAVAPVVHIHLPAASAQPPWLPVRAPYVIDELPG